MNLSELLQTENNSIVILHYSRVQIERLVLLFLFDKSIQEGEYGLLIHFSQEQIKVINELTKNDFTDQILSIDDPIERMSSSINIFHSIESFNQFKLKHTNLLEKLIELNIKLLIFDCKFDRLEVESLHLDFTFPINDRFIPITFLDCNKKELFKSIKFIEDNDDSLHFESIPDYVQFVSLRSSIINSSLKLFFYIEYSKDGEINDEGLKYNDLIERIESENIKLNNQKKGLNCLNVKLSSDGIVIEK